MNSADTILRKLFNENRAEWPQEDFKKLFVEPTYLNKLESIRPCVLVGGRGTGKTTSLQSLKYDSTLERLEMNGLNFGDQEYLGILIRMNKNRVKVFEGNQLEESEWRKLFAHYFNLLVCLEIVKLTQWLETKSEISLAEEEIENVALDLGLELATNTLLGLRNSIKRSISKIQLYVNSPLQAEKPIISMPESPLRVFSEALKEQGLLNGRMIFCCIDEYENLSDSQQAIINTYIKHAAPPLSYKVGVRKNGFRNRQTLDENDLLVVPDDFAEIEIVDEGFEYFATRVAELRLEFARGKGINVPFSLKKFLKDLSFAEEAVTLGASEIANIVKREIKNSNQKQMIEFFESKADSEIYFLEYWRQRSDNEILDLAKDWMENPKAWKVRLENHGYASLFWISKGNKGQRIRKYYCGERVLLALSGGNIRYFLELINNAIQEELTKHDSESAQEIIISPKSQTIAARMVGQNRLNQLEGLADNGVRLKRLILAIGKVFFEFARTPENRAPEINSFVLTGDKEHRDQVIELLREGVGHLAFEAEPRTKATTNNELRDDEYRLHRIFTGFFEFSHRKKRRTTFDAKHLIEVLEDKPAKAITKLVEGKEGSNSSNVKQKRIEVEELPEQLAFFTNFFGAGEN